MFLFFFSVSTESEKKIQLSDFDQILLANLEFTPFPFDAFFADWIISSFLSLFLQFLASSLLFSFNQSSEFNVFSFLNVFANFFFENTLAIWMIVKVKIFLPSFRLLNDRKLNENSLLFLGFESLGFFFH